MIEQEAREASRHVDRRTAARSWWNQHGHLQPVERYFDGTYFAINYARTRSHSRALAPLFRREASAIHERCRRLLEPFAIESVLDLGCGTGLFLHDLRERGLASGTGVDVSERSVALATQRFSGERTFQFEHAAALDCGALQRTHDAVVCLGMFDYCPLDSTILGRLFSAARAIVVLTVPDRRTGLRHLLRVAWLAAHAIRLQTWNQAELSNLARETGDHHWVVDVERSDFDNNLWLVARREQGHPSC